MSRHWRVERLPSGVHFKEPPAQRIYKPNLIARTGARGQTDRPDSNPIEGLFPTFMRSYVPDDKPAHPPSGNVKKTTPASRAEPQTLCLPLLQVSVEVSVYRTIADTTLIQYFDNVSSESIPEANYTFPLYNGAVVTAFQYEIGERVFIGKVKPREQARKEFQKAVENRKAAALLGEHTPEIFETSIGHIPAKTQVRIKIAYASELRASVLDGTSEGLDVVIPTSIAPRYGTSFGSSQMLANFRDDGLDITINVRDDGTIQDLRSPTHRNRVRIEKNVPVDRSEASKVDQKETGAAPTQMCAVYKSHTSTLHADFVLHIEMRPSNPLKSFAILSPTAKNGQSAMMINIKPSEIFQGSSYQAQEFDGEIIFVLDRSGSMDWNMNGTDDGFQEGSKSKIATLRRAMPLSLASLPINCAFNIVSFGSHTEVLWPESRPYSDENRKYAMDYVKTVQANMGGTELWFAVKTAVKSRLEDRKSTQVIIITDGEVEAERTIEFVRETRLQLRDQIRFFALGIGDQVSHRLIEGIGEFGGGYGEVVNLRANPVWENSLSRMLRCGVMPDSWTLGLDLGPGFERQDLVDYRLGTRLRDGLTPYIQAPYPMPSLHPFTYRSIYILLDAGSKLLPTQVVLRPHHSGTRTGAQHCLVVEPTQMNEVTIHQLATKKILTALQADVERAAVDQHMGRNMQANAEKLGVMYSIPSRWTSFVAVDQDERDCGESSELETEMIPVPVRELQCSSEIVGPWGRGSDFAQYCHHPVSTFENQQELLSARPLISRSPAPKRRQSSREDLCVDDYDNSSHNNSKFADTPMDSRRRKWPVVPSLKTHSSQVSPISSGMVRQAAVDSRFPPGDHLDLSGHTHFSMPAAYASKRVNTVQRVNDESFIDEDITWRKFADVQKSSGLFELSPSWRDPMRRHFRPNTWAALDLALVQRIAPSRLGGGLHYLAVDTLMTIVFFEVHLFKEKELWSMMMDKAEYAIGQVWQLSGAGGDDTFASVKQMVARSSKHQHFLAATGNLPAAPPNRLSPADDHSAFHHDGKLADQVAFVCRSTACQMPGVAWTSWDDLWQHQVEEGHVICIID